MSPTASRLELGAVSRLFRALGDELRVRMVALLTHGELCVCHLEAALELPQPTCSRHLAILRAAGVVERRRDQRWVYYRLAEQADPYCRRQLGELVRAFGQKDVLRRDVARLLRTQGPGRCA
jgi:ArsR family transcriptional regulator